MLLSLNRRRSGAIVLAIIAIAALVRLRSTCESSLVIAAEISLNAMLVLLTAWLATRGSATTAFTPSLTNQSFNGASSKKTALVKRNSQSLQLIGAVLCVLFPLIANFVERRAGEGTGAEIAYMGALAWGGLVAAIFAKLSRTISISVVCSGFLTLFTTVSSDQQSAVYVALAWGLVCLWWIIANHWELVEACQVDSIKSTNLRSPIAILAGCLVFVVAAWSASGRSVMFNRLTAELMPTSGGTGASDASARSGVGDGDAVVAARDHAASFGAVETDVFLDSPQPSLFDMFNDTFGEPVRKKKNERAIALAPRENQSTSSRTAQSNSSTQSFTTHRSEPKPRKPLKDVASKAIMFWIGRAGERLATERCSRFDGTEWHQEAAATKLSIIEQKINDRVWFGTDPNHGLVLGPYVEARAEAVKFTRYRSNRIPAPAGVQMWHIDLVDQADFFGFSPDQCLEMPGRDHVPDYTTVRLVNRLIDIEKLDALTARCTGVPTDLYPSASELSNDGGVQLAKQTMLTWLDNSRHNSQHNWSQHNWQTVQLVVDRLRREFTFDRNVATGSTTAEQSSLEMFLTKRRGNDVMFATAAAVMLREVGFRTRFVTGFYVDPKNQDRLTGQTPITAQDTHAWLEVDVGMGTWIPLEPTPGYQVPIYRVSWVYRLKQNAAAIGVVTAGFVLFISTLWFCRAYVFEGWLRSMRCMLPYVSDRRRVRWLVRVLDRRCQLAGISRPNSVSPRDWLKRSIALDNAAWSGSMIRFFNEADQLNYGSSKGLSAEGRQACAELWRDASTFCLRRLRPGSERQPAEKQSVGKTTIEKRINWNGGLEC